MPDMKTYGVGFYVGKVGADGKGGKVSKILSELKASGRHPAIKRGNVYFEVRELREIGNGASYTGIFAKFRIDDIPHIGEPEGPERPIDLSGKEGLIEKNHFIYYREYELLVYQQNKNASSETRLAEYLSDIVNETITFDPVLQPEAMRRLLKADTDIRTLELSFARPTNPDIFPSNNWGAQLMSLLQGANGARMHLKISADGRRGSPHRQHLPKMIKRAVKDFVGKVDTRVAKIKVEEDGLEHTIDLIEDRLKAHVQVEMDGRYPNTSRMFEALRHSRDEHYASLKEIFGHGQHKVD